MSQNELKKTPLNAVHRALGGKMVDFGGWEMPVQYPAGVIEEHLATRTRAGLFDVSHMGEIWAEGPGALDFINFLTTNDVRKLVDGQAQYSVLCNDKGGAVDDLLVYRFDNERFLLVVNAATTDKDWNWISGHLAGNSGVKLRNASAEFCQIAIQGPQAVEILQSLTDTKLSDIKYYHFETGKAAGVECIISRTGYTGEDGFELYASPEFAEKLWNSLTEAGKSFDILPCGLAARNTLRLESAMSLYGHELSDEISPLEANLGWIVKLDKGDFIGRPVLADQKLTGLKRRIAGFEMREPGIARDGFDVYAGEEKIGYVTSGSPAPFLKKNIGLALLQADFANPGTEIKIDVRGKRIGAEIVPIPFYKRKK